MENFTITNCVNIDNLADINAIRSHLIEAACSKISKSIKPGVEYTAYDLSHMCEGLIPTSNFYHSIVRGYSVIKREKKSHKNSWDMPDRYFLFGYYPLACRIVKYQRTVLVKEYDEYGELISEYTKRRGRATYKVIFD